MSLKLCKLIDCLIRIIYRKNHTKNVYQKIVPHPFWFLADNPKQPLHVRKKLTLFILWNPLLFNAQNHTKKTKGALNLWPVTLQVTKHIQKKSLIKDVIFGPE